MHEMKYSFVVRNKGEKKSMFLYVRGSKEQEVHLLPYFLAEIEETAVHAEFSFH